MIRQEQEGNTNMLAITTLPDLFLKALLATVFLGVAVQAQDDKKSDDDGGDKDPVPYNPPRFIFPIQENLKFYRQDVVNVSWYSYYDDPSLLMWCWSDGKTYQMLQLPEVAPDDGWEMVNIPKGVDGNTCWFNLKSSKQGEINSVPFALTSNGRPETTLGLWADTTTASSKDEPTRTQNSPTGLTASSGLPIGSASGSPSGSGPASSSKSGSESGGGNDDDDSNSSGSDGMSAGAKAGIGVGVSLGVLGIAAFVGAFVMLRLRKKKDADNVVAEKDMPEAGGEAVQPYHPVHMTPPQELPGNMNNGFDEGYGQQPTERKPVADTYG